MKILCAGLLVFPVLLLAIPLIVVRLAWTVASGFLEWVMDL